MSFDTPSQKPPQAVTESKLMLRGQVRIFLSDMVSEESGRVDLPEEGEEERVSRVREVARELVQKLLLQKEEARAEALRKTRVSIVKYKEIKDDPNDPDGQHHDLVPDVYDGLYGRDFDGLLKMLPENAAILKEAAEILQMPLEQARQDLEMGE